MIFSKNKWFDFLFVKSEKKLIYLIFFALLGSALVGYLTPKLISDFYASYDDQNKFFYYLKFIFFVFLFEYLIRVIYQLSINKYIEKLLQKIRTDSFINWLSRFEPLMSGSSNKDKFPLGEVISRILTDAEAVMELISSRSFAIFIDFIFIISCLVSFLSLNTTSGIFLILSETLACVFLIWASKFMAKIFMEVRKSSGIMARVLANVSAGMRTMFFTPHGNFAVKKSEKSFNDFLYKQLKANVWDASYYSLAESLFPILLALLVVLVPYGQIYEMAIIAAIIDLIQRSITPIKDIASKISSIQRAKAGIVRIEEFNTELKKGFKSIDEKRVELNFSSLEVNIESFYYSKKSKNEFHLQNIHFSGKKGELIGIVGLSGSGKSTLLKILSSEIFADKSQIILNSEDQKKIVFEGANLLNASLYRSQVSIISQDSHVFTASLLFNITLGLDFNNYFPKFWEETLSKLSYLQNWNLDVHATIYPKDLSLGQKQLICALRASFMTRPIVLFDEISSGLDSELEFALRELLLDIQKNALTIIVAHRIETVMGSNLILVMEEGEIRNQGTHHELIKDSPAYLEFITQLKES